MKRISSLVLAALLVLGLSACSAAPATPTAAAQAPVEASPAAPPGASDASGGILIAYFSVPETDGVDAVAGASRVVVDGAVLGSNQYVAQLIQAEVGGDLFRIETEQTYPGEHDALLGMAWLMVFVTGQQKGIRRIGRRDWLFLLLSGLSTGLSWLCYYRALQDGPASVVVPVDKLSILVTIVFSRLILHEKLSRRAAAGLALLVLGTGAMLL